MDDQKEDDVPPKKEVLNEEEAYGQEKKRKYMNAEQGARVLDQDRRGQCAGHGA